MSYCEQLQRNATKEFDATSGGTFRRLKNPGGEVISVSRSSCITLSHRINWLGDRQCALRRIGMNTSRDGRFQPCQRPAWRLRQL